MTEKERTLKQRKAQPAGREVYKRPKLKTFGPVGALTQSGTGMSVEMAQGNNSKKML